MKPISASRSRACANMPSRSRCSPASRRSEYRSWAASAAIIDNFSRSSPAANSLMAFTASYGQISPIIPYVIVAPFYFARKLQLGVMTQTAGAFGSVEGALTFFVTYYVASPTSRRCSTV